MFDVGDRVRFSPLGPMPLRFPPDSAWTDAASRRTDNGPSPGCHLEILVVVPPPFVIVVVPPVAHRETAVAVPVEPFDDVGKRAVELGAGDDRVAVGIEHLEGAHGERARDLMPQPRELVEVEVSIAVGVVRHARRSLRAASISAWVSLPSPSASMESNISIADTANCPLLSMPMPWPPSR